MVGGTVVDEIVVDELEVDEVVVVVVVVVELVLDDVGVGGTVLVTGAAPGSEVHPAATTAPTTPTSRADRHAATPTRGMATPYDSTTDGAATATSQTTSPPAALEHARCLDLADGGGAGERGRTDADSVDDVISSPINARVCGR